MVFGINWDLANEPAWNATSPEQVRSWGFQGVRGVMHPLPVWTDRAHAVKAAGLVLLGVYTGQSYGFISELADIVQVHNEPKEDMPPERFVDEYTTIRSHVEDALGYHPQWMLPGLHRGPDFDIPWLDEVFDRLGGGYTPDAVALHLYTHSPQSARDYCDRVRERFGIRVACTEWYRSAGEGLHPMQCVLGGDGLDGNGPRAGYWNSYFCMSDHMTHWTEHTHLGILDLDGHTKPEWEALLSAPEECRQ